MSKKTDNKNILSNNNIGKIENKAITEEMQECYLDYAMSVIVSRALPDVRDGLKPVHRRILYAMYDIGLKSQAKFRKSATVVGEVLGKYHPHSDTSVYDSLVRMAQDFSMRYPLIHGQGNFGSMDGDSAAAMRYTEAKLNRIAEEMLLDIDKETVDFVDNYDKSKKEPSVLPSKIPQLLLNGSVGIAVGMATNIPPHNLCEVIDATVYLINNKNANVTDLLKFIKGPDFPTGGLIYGQNDIEKSYSTGKGKIDIRAKAEIFEKKKNHFQIIISEIIYQVNKSALIEKIAELVKTKKIEGIKDIRDESDKEGVRIVIDLKSDAYPKKVLNKLYNFTDIQKSFHLNMLALVDGIQPKVLNLKEILEYYILHRKKVVYRKTQFELSKAKERAHILEGLNKALDYIDEIIQTIKKSETKESARIDLMKKFKLSDKQSTAILEMKLQTLAGLERKKIKDELEEKRKLIIKLESILKSGEKIMKIIEDELIDIKNKYGDKRKTKVYKNAIGEFSQEDLVPKEDAVIAITKEGYIKRMTPQTYHVQHRGGKGVIGASLKEEDGIDNFFLANTHSSLLFFTSYGKVFQTKAYEIPASARTAKGQSIVNFLQLSTEEKVTAVIPLDDKKSAKFLVMETENGIIKKTSLEKFSSVKRASGLIAIKLRGNDRLKWVKESSGENKIVVVTSAGKSIIFEEKDIRSMGRSASGVNSIKLKSGENVVGMDIVSNEELKENYILTISENGFGKLSNLKLYRIQHRGGVGIKTAVVNQKTGKIIVSKIINKNQLKKDIIVISSKGQVIRVSLSNVRKSGRSSIGVRIMRLKENDKVSSIAIV